MTHAAKLIALALVLQILASCTAQMRAADVVDGRIQSVSTEEAEFVITDLTGKEWLFRLADSAQIRTCAVAAEQLPQQGSIGELRACDAVTVTYTGRGMPLIALDVCVKRD